MTRDKVAVDDIIGIVHTDETTNSVEEVRKLRGRKNEKRFTVKQRQGATIYSIEDYYGELPLSEGMYYKSNAEKLCKWLNTQHELLTAFCKENEQLKSYTGEMEDYLARLEEKNEQLKADKQALIDFIRKEFPKSHKHILEGFE